MINNHGIPCKLCGKVTGKIASVTSAVYYHCPRCDLIFLDEEYLIDEKEEHYRYKQHNNSLDNKGYVDYLTKFIKNAGIDRARGIKKALDFGCGPGPVLKVLLSRLGFDVDIYDPYFFPERVFEKKQYDLITCTEVLEHLKNPLEVLILLESLLKENGILAVMTLFHTTSDNFKQWWYRRDPTHICFYSPKTFKWIENNFNLTIKTIDNRSVCVLQKNVRTGG